VKPLASDVSSGGGEVRSVFTTCIQTHGKQPHPAERPSAMRKVSWLSPYETRHEESTLGSPPSESSRPTGIWNLILPAQHGEAFKRAIAGVRYNCG
jgi:hypothetical protein